MASWLNVPADFLAFILKFDYLKVFKFLLFFTIQYCLLKYPWCLYNRILFPCRIDCSKLIL